MSVPKCGPLKSKWLLETGERRNFFRGPGLYDRLWRRAGQQLQGGWLVAGQGLYRKMEQKISWTGSPLRRARLGPKKKQTGGCAQEDEDGYTCSMGVCKTAVAGIYE